jgi:hypothetical protein
VVLAAPTDLQDEGPVPQSHAPRLDVGAAAQREQAGDIVLTQVRVGTSRPGSLPKM